jgi:HSP20 family molecular chaperone IbpA
MPFKEFGQGGPMHEWSRKIQTIMDEMRHRNFCHFRASGAWQPTVNLYASRGAYHVCVELAGVGLDSVVVKCHDPRHVCIAGQRCRPGGSDLDASFSVEMMEIDEGAFSRKIDLPDPVDVDDVEVRHDEGYLWITLRKITTT